MVMPDHWQDAAQRLQRGADALPNNGMLPDDLGLFRVQCGGLEKNLIWHGHFSDIVKQACDPQLLQFFFRQTHTAAEMHGVLCYPVGVPVHERMFRFDAAGQRKHHGLRLFIDIRLEPQERLHAA